jgi:Putative DNA-binding domain
MTGMAPELAAQQTQLLAQIFAARVQDPSRGLAVYRANAHASAERALAAAYPVLAQLVGADNFCHLARDFWHQHPPVCGDLAQWGDALPQFVGNAVQLQDTAYLADVACIEWALHQCASAADKVQDLSSFSLLTQHPPEALAFVWAPGVCMLHSPHPAATITLAHQGQGVLEAAAAMLHVGTAQTALVWRHGFVPRLKVLPDDDVSFMDALLQGASLAGALDAAHQNFDFSGWLTASVHGGLVLGVLMAF